MIRAFLSFVFLWSLTQVSSQILAQDSRPRTNDGSVFQDPFGDEAPTDELEDTEPPTMPEDDEFPIFVDESELNENSSSEQPPSGFDESFEGEGEAPLEDSFEDFAEEDELEQAPAKAPVAPLNEGPVKETEADSDEVIFEFPSEEEASGPVSQEVFRKKMSAQIAPKGAWFLSFRPQIGYNLNKRPFQLGFEVEGSYRFNEKFDLSLITGYRFLKDRLFGFVVLPSWNFQLTKESESRIDLRLGAGLGWYLQGVRGSDFQFGQFPIRLESQLAYYLNPKMALLFNVGFEMFLLRTETGGGTTNQLSEPGGMPMQGLVGFGMRFEFW
ncbi:MAG: hypothetical protein ACO3LE_07740 [Bdellovibrionota bacterium]